MKKSRTRHTTKSSVNRKHVIAFVISVFLIGIMLIEVLLAVQDAQAHGQGRGKFCRRSGRGSFFSFCRTGNANSCGDGCTCTPFSKKMKWGVCRGDGTNPPKPSIVPCTSENDLYFNKETKGRPGQEHGKPGKPCQPTTGPNPSTKPTLNPTNNPNPTEGPNPTDPPAGSGACGVTCTVDRDCASGYCNPVGFPICPTSEPGMPIEECQFFPIDPTTQNKCAPATCRGNNTSDLCSCPAN